MGKGIVSVNRLEEEHGNESSTLEAQSSNNHVATFYFPSFSIFMHVHVVTFSFKDNSGRKLIIGLLESLGFKLSKKWKLNNGKYLWKSKYQKDSMIVEFKYQPTGELIYLPSFLMNVHNPSREFIDGLVTHCEYFKLKGIVSKIELAFDFYTDKNNIPDVFDFLKSCLFMKYQRTSSCVDRYLFTFYANHLKHQSRGLKVYFRKGRKFVRLELTLKRLVIKNLGIDMPLTKVESINPFDFFKFMQLDEKKLREYVIWQNRHDLEHLEKESRFGAGLPLCHIDSWLSSWPLEPKSLMGKIDVLKSKNNGIKNYTRFLIPLDDFIELFTDKIKGQLFVPHQADLEKIHNSTLLQYSRLPKTKQTSKEKEK